MGIENLFWIGFVGGALSLLFSLIQLGRVLPLPEGGSPAQGLAVALRKGTNAYLKWQILLSAPLLVLVMGLLAGLCYLDLLKQVTAGAFLSGSLCCLFVGIVSAKMTAAAGPRAADAAGGRLDRGVDAALCAGSVVSFLSAGLGLFHITGWFFVLKHSLGYGPEDIAFTMLFFGAGSGFMALLLRMGSLFSVSARLAGQMVDREMGLPPDSPQNPAAIALRVGHGVGAAAGKAGGTHWGFENAILAAFALGASAYAPRDMGWNAMLLPLVMAAAGTFCSTIGLFAVPAREQGDRYSLPWSLRLSEFLSALLTAIISFPVCYFLTGSWDLCWAIVAGLVAGLTISLLGEYFTSDTYRPARRLSETAESGIVPVIAGGLGAGLSAAALPGLLAAAALVAAFLTAGGMGDLSKGLYAVTLAGVGMLSVSGTFLAASLCGSTGDNAADALSLIDDGESARRRADNLAAIGISAASGGACLDVAADALTGLALLAGLTQAIRHAGSEQSLLQANSGLLLGILLGGITLLLFLGLLLRGIRRTALSTAAQAREQFRASEGLLEGSDAPDYAACVNWCGGRALLFFLPPLLLAVLSPLVAGLLLGEQGLWGFLGSLLFLAILLPPAFALSGGILSGARRYIESGKRGGRGSDTHRAVLQAESALIPLRDVAGPALAAFLKLALPLSLVCYATIQMYNLPGLLG